ncbi:MAG: hypothetical protein R2754_05170 [Microthrixaceae bacterium]
MDANSAEGIAARGRLTEEKEHLLGLLENLEKEFADDGGIRASADIGARTTSAEANFGVREGLEHQLAEVNAALERLDNGTYGIDEDTGKPINPARLEAEPTARTDVHP